MKKKNVQEKDASEEIHHSSFTGNYSSWHIKVDYSANEYCNMIIFKHIVLSKLLGDAVFLL